MDNNEIRDRAEGMLILAQESASEAFSAHLNHMSREDQVAVLREMERQNTIARAADPSLAIITFDTPTDACGQHVDNVQILRKKDWLDVTGWFGDKYDATKLYELPPDNKLVCQTAEAIKSRGRQLQTSH